MNSIYNIFTLIVMMFISGCILQENNKSSQVQVAIDNNKFPVLTSFDLGLVKYNNGQDIRSMPSVIRQELEKRHGIVQRAVNIPLISITEENNTLLGGVIPHIKLGIEIQKKKLTKIVLQVKDCYEEQIQLGVLNDVLNLEGLKDNQEVKTYRQSALANGQAIVSYIQNADEIICIFYDEDDCKLKVEPSFLKELVPHIDIGVKTEDGILVFYKKDEKQNKNLPWTISYKTWNLKEIPVAAEHKTTLQAQTTEHIWKVFPQPMQNIPPDKAMQE